MNERPDIRWKQRYAHFDQALQLLDQALRSGIASLSQLEKEGLVHRFEFTFELAWKTVKDYLEEEGVTLTIVTPREVIKEAFAANIIQDGAMWVRMLDHRNLLAHTYDDHRFEEAVLAIDQHYIHALRSIHALLHDRSAGR